MLNGPKGSFVIVDYVILAAAVIINCLVLQGIIRAKFNLAGYRHFLISLAVSELYVCGVNFALFLFEILTWYMPNSFGSHCESHILRSFQLVGFFANLLNLLGMSVDHFIGIVYPLKYRSWMTTFVSRMAVAAIWIVAFICGFADMPVAVIKYSSRETTSNNKPAVCSGNVISDIVDILESSDFLTANSQLLFSDADRTRVNAMNRDANSSANEPLHSLFLSFAQPNAFRADILDQFLPFQFVGLQQRVRKTSATLSRNSVRNSALSTQVALSFSLKSTALATASTVPSTSTTPTAITTTTPPPITSQATTVIRIVQSPENEVALCEALIKAQNKMEDHSWCADYGSDPWLEICIMSLTVVCFIFFTFCYGKIFRKVFVEAEFKRRKTSKMVVTTCLLLSAFAICYLPFMLYEFFMMWYDDLAQMQSSTTFLLVHNVFNSLLLSYPLLDPVIFVARSPPVLRNILHQFRWLIPCCPSVIQARLTLSQQKSLDTSFAISASQRRRSDCEVVNDEIEYHVTATRGMSRIWRNSFRRQTADSKHKQAERLHAANAADHNNTNNCNNNNSQSMNPPIITVTPPATTVVTADPDDL